MQNWSGDTSSSGTNETCVVYRGVSRLFWYVGALNQSCKMLSAMVPNFAHSLEQLRATASKSLGVTPSSGLSDDSLNDPDVDDS